MAMPVQHSGQPIGQDIVPETVQDIAAPPPLANTSGQGKAAVLPAELRGLNWGALLLNWIWGIGNGVWIALLALLPGVGLVVAVVLLFKGNEWAWRNRSWRSVRHFRRVQRTWAICGLALVAAAMVLPALALGYAMQQAKASEYYRAAMARVNADPRVTDALGSPVEAGWYVLGSLETAGEAGTAELRIPLQGPKGRGTARLTAEKLLGPWSIRELAVTVAATGDWIPIVMPPYECGSASC
jgi:hypothetical protein